MGKLDALTRGVVAGAIAVASTAAGAAVDATVRAKLDALAVPFVPNGGQWDPQAAFAAQTFAGTLFVTRDGRLVYRLPGKPAALDRGANDRLSLALSDRRQRGAHPAPPDWVLSETLVAPDGKALPAAPVGVALQPGTTSYAIGADPARHRAALPAYERVRLGEVYPGIEVELRATGSNVEKIFTVAPHADPAAIRLRLEGALSVELGEQGELIARTGNGPVAYTPPVAYQEDASGRRADVPVRYALEAATGTYRFAVDRYDRSRPLVIDPLLQSTYLGGTHFQESITAMAVHHLTGEIYVAGWTQSTDFPKVTGGAQATYGTGIEDAFVTRLNATLTSRLQSTYLGGSASDQIKALAIHPTTGDVYVAGTTFSGNFPFVTGSEQTASGGDFDGFVARLNPQLTSVLQATYLGGAGTEYINAMAIHPATGEVYVAGNTTSSPFPKTTGGADATKDLLADGFITRLNQNLTTRIQSTYFGGDDYDDIAAIAIHPWTGNVYVAGTTLSSALPGLAGAEQTTNAGGQDMFVSRLNANLTSVVQSTFLGGLESSSENMRAMAIHPLTGEIYVAGVTSSVDFPKTSGGNFVVFGANNYGFVTRLNEALTIRLQSARVGGSVSTYGEAIAIHPASGDVFLAGYTGSADLPGTAGGVQPDKPAGAQNAFVIRLIPDLTAYWRSTYFGGAVGSSAGAVAIHPATGDLYLAGNTASADLPGTAGSEQPALSGSGDTFVARMSSDLREVDGAPDPFSFAPRVGVTPGSQQTSNPVRMTGFVSSTVGIAGGSFAQFCIANSADCAPASCAIAYGSIAASINNNQYVCVRQNAPQTVPGISRASVTIGGVWADFVVTTGNLSEGTNCTLDVDGNGTVDALTDGLMILRAMFGLTGTAVTNAAVGSGATRSIWADLRTYLNGNCGTGFAP